MPSSEKISTLWVPRTSETRGKIVGVLRLAPKVFRAPPVNLQAMVWMLIQKMPGKRQYKSLGSLMFDDSFNQLIN